MMSPVSSVLFVKSFLLSAVSSMASPALYNGNRVVKIGLNDELPYFVRVGDFPCRAW